MYRMILLFTALLISGMVSAVEIPAGWNRYDDHAKKTIRFKPVNQNADIMVKYYPKQLLEGESVKSWLTNKLETSRAPQGEWLGELTRFTRESFNRSFGFRKFRRSDGSIGMLGAVAFSADLLYVRLAMIMIDENVSEVLKDQGYTILKAMDQDEIANAKAEWRGLDLETGTPKVRGVKKGGSIRAGRYVGQKTVSGEARGDYTVILYETGEYEFPNFKKKKSGYYTYSERFGKLYMRDPFTSSMETYKDYCVYGTSTKTGKPVIYAYDSPAEYRLNWVGEVDRLSPSQRKKLEKQKQEKGYAYTTNPGDGLSLDEIETILYVYEESKTQGNTPLHEEIYLLTKKGRVMDGLPVAPNQLDVAKSQNREPDRWGWWKHDGERYSFAWSTDRSHYVVPRGRQLKTQPIPAGTRLEGEWLASTTYHGEDFVSTTAWGDQFSRDGRFTNQNSELIKVNGRMLESNRKHSKQLAGEDDTGHYEFDGYSLVLKYQSGDVRHLPTFTLDGDFKQIWFRGRLLSQN
ncbi:MAG: hypothetical protein JAY90_15570 [Candidatus Thiodiazotropha lotti]|nr:hypothetical protein [Candidatus Thiodiazotropha lotti]